MSTLDISNFDIKGIIFDCDGVLVDSEYFSCLALNRVFKKNFNIDIGDDFNQVIGTSLKDSIDYYFNKFSINRSTIQLDFTKFSSEKDQKYFQLAKNKLKTFSGIEKLINYALKNTMEIAVASSGSLEKINFNLEQVKMKNYFKFITSSQEVVKGKPNPELFLLTAKKINLKPNQCLVIEDSITGIKAAKSAKMLAVGITNTFSKEQLEQAGANMVIKQADEIISYLDKPKIVEK